jgi:hypothetical protein
LNSSESNPPSPANGKTIAYAAPDSALPEAQPRVVNAYPGLAKVAKTMGVLVAVLAPLAIVLGFASVLETETGGDRIYQLLKVFVLLAFFITPAVGYRLFANRLRTNPANQQYILAMSFVHSLLGGAACGMWWETYSWVYRLLFLAWAACGVITFIVAAVTEARRQERSGEG